MMAKEEQMSFLSKNGTTAIHAVKWLPENGEYRAILQITHGMVEFIERYRPFAEFLTRRGFTVVGHDHLGHGASVNSEEEWGYFAKNPSDTLVADMHQLRTQIQGAESGRTVFYAGAQHGLLYAEKIFVHT